MKHLAVWDMWGSKEMIALVVLMGVIKTLLQCIDSFQNQNSVNKIMGERSND